jgi:putative hydrolase of the HAD superfamily
VKARSEIAAVSFDAGGTLIAPWPSVGHAYVEIARRHGEGGLDPVEVNRRFLAAWQGRGPAFDYSRRAWAALVAESLRGLTPLADDPEYFRELYEHFAGPEPWRVYPDVLPALEELRRRGYRLAVLSNWDARLRPLLIALGLARHFDWLGVSSELGVHKPDPRIFERAARSLGVPPGAIVHVGDSFEEDVAGARAAGWRAVWLARDGGVADGPAGPALTSLAGLPGWLRGR